MVSTTIAGTVGSLMLKMDAPKQATELLSMAVNAAQRGGMKDTHDYAGILANLKSAPDE